MKQEIIENILNNFETPIYVFDIDKLKQRINFLRENLPVFMIPNKLTQIDKFPITKNGKIDRKELAVMVKK